MRSDLVEIPVGLEQVPSGQVKGCKVSREVSVTRMKRARGKKEGKEGKDVGRAPLYILTSRTRCEL